MPPRAGNTDLPAPLPLLMLPASTPCPCRLSAGGNSITAGFGALAALRQLTHLALLGSPVLPPELSHLRALEVLNLNYSPALAASSDWHNLESLENLRVVSAVGCGLPSIPHGVPGIFFGAGTW